jgi:Cd2+/Zn2+-exporting ATPase
MKKFFNEDLIKIIISTILFIISFFIDIEVYKLIVLLLSYIIISYEMYIESIKNILKGEIFDENFLMIIATIGAFFISSYTEAVMVILLFQIGEYFSDLAVDKSKESITKLMDLRVDKVNLEVDGEIKVVKTEKVKLNDIFVVKPGEKIPLDGVVVEGESFLDTASLTGESVPRKAKVDDIVLSGCINNDSILRVKATSTYKTTTAQKIIDLIENSNDSKTETETFIRKFAKIYTPIVVLCAVLLVVIPTIAGLDFKSWLYRALVFLVTSCPCALVISVPLGYFCGIGKCSTEGILVKGSKELESLCNVDYLVLDKTGTITEGVFQVDKIDAKMDEEEFIKLISSAEVNSIHPIASAVKEKCESDDLYEISNYKEISGQGISCTIKGKKILVGNDKLLKENNVKFEETDDVGTIIYLAVDGKYKGYLVIADKIKKSSYNLGEVKEVINKDIIILSGDNENIVRDVAKKVGVSEYLYELLPIDKVNYVRDFKEKGKVMFVGDGINDAPVIKMADIGVSMGGIGSDAAIEASDIVLMNDDLDTISKSIEIAKLTNKKVKESIVLALAVKIVVLILGVFGISTILLAVFADVGVTFLAILNVLLIFLKKFDKKI